VNDEAPRINAAALLLARGRPNQPALACSGRTLSYLELRKLVARAATAWVERGVSPGEVVMLRGEHDLAQVVAFLGAMWAGAVPVPLRATPAPEGADGAEGLVVYQVQRANTRPGHGDATRAWYAWSGDLHGGPPTPAVPRLPGDAACWSDPRSWREGSTRVLPHRFALALVAQPGTLPLARAGTMLAVLRALRRGVTAALQPQGSDAHWAEAA
jgi:hypothetical protein